MRATLQQVILTTSVIVLLLPAAAKTIHVPADQPTIQAAINAAHDGDRVLVSSGTYKENINFNGKAITVTSASGPATTVIDGQQLAPVAVFSSGETRTATLSGFTLQNGNGSVNGYQGGGVDIGNASPTIMGNIIALNASCGDGSAIKIDGGAPLIQSNVIGNNGNSMYCGSGFGALYVASGSGSQIVGNVISANSLGGISMFSTSGSTTILGNAVTYNSGVGIYLGGTGARLVQNEVTGNQQVGVSWANAPVTLVSNTLANNQVLGYSNYPSSEIYAGVMNDQVEMKNNLVIGVSSYPALYCSSYDSTNPPIFTNNDLFGSTVSAYGGSCPDLSGANGNISADPLFVTLLSDNFHLQSGSAAIDAGDNSAPGLQMKDFDGDARILNNVADIGVDEYTSTTRLTLSASQVFYGPQEVGSNSSPQTATLTNNGSSKIAISLVAATADYTQTNNCGASLAAGASCQINTVFSPVSGGARPGALGVMTSATPNPLVTSLSGTGLAPAAYLSQAYVYFYNQIVGTTASQVSMLTNNGLAPLKISSISIAGASDFTQTNDCPIAPSTLGIGASCNITITWTPVLIGGESATVTLTDNATPNTQTISVSGSSYSAGTPTFTPNTLTFPDTPMGGTSSPQSVTLTNTGTGSLGNLTVYSYYYDFPVTSDCPTSLSPGASCTVTVTFTPTGTGAESGYIYVNSDALSNPTLNANGNSLAPVPSILSLSPASAAAGSTDTTITITGTGLVYGSQVIWNGNSLYAYPNGNNQLTVTVPASYFASAGTAQVSVFTPAPGGGTSNALPFTIYLPIPYLSKPTTYDYRNITGTNLNLFYYSSAVITPPFPIQFGGGSFSTLTVGAGGTVSFNGFASESHDMIPTAQTPLLVAPFWADLFPWGFNSNDNDVFWQVNGSAPDRELVIEWRDVNYCCTSDPAHTVRFQVVFFEGNSNMLFNYADTIFGGSYSANDNGATATAGIQVAPGNGNQFSYNSPSLKSQKATFWYPGLPTATVSASTLSFGYHQIGIPSTLQKVTLTNGGLVPLSITSIATDNPDFTSQNNCGSSLPAGQSCAIQLRFLPSQPSAESATLTITDNASNNPQTVALSGIGTITSVVVFPIQLSFGSVTVGQSSTLPVTLANASNQTMTIQQIAASPSQYTETTNCGTSLGAGASCTVNVTFAPDQTGILAGTLSMGLNGKPPVAKVQMKGAGK